MNHAHLVDLASTSLEDTELLRFPALTAIDGFSHAVTARPWNMASHCGPEVKETERRRRRICQELGFSFDQLTAPDQVHSPHVIPIRPSDVGAGREGRHTALRFVDGMVCNLPGVPLMQFSADCPMIVLIEPNARVLGTAHASWRGTVAGIATELVRQLNNAFSVDPSSLIGAIAPCAGPMEYEVGEDVRRVAEARLPGAERFFYPAGEKWRFDMRAANVDQLCAAGVVAENIQVASISTMSDSRFYSVRNDGAETGRFSLIAGFV